MKKILIGLLLLSATALQAVQESNFVLTPGEDLTLTAQLSPLDIMPWDDITFEWIVVSGSPEVNYQLSTGASMFISAPGWEDLSAHPSCQIIVQCKIYVNGTILETQQFEVFFNAITVPTQAWATRLIKELY